MIPLKDNIPARALPFVNLALITVNITLFCYAAWKGTAFVDALVERYSLVPAEFLPLGHTVRGRTAFPPVTLVSSLFLHGGLLHLGGNMLYLFVFGKNVEVQLGHLRYFGFYIFTGIAASLVQMFTDMHSSVPVIGASGAVSGVLGAYVILLPKARIQTLVFILFFLRVLSIPALLFIGIWFVGQIYGAEAQHSNIAWNAHIGGFAFGVCAALVVKMSPKKPRKITAS